MKTLELTAPSHWASYLNPRGHVVWLSPKGRKAIADKSGFVLR